MYIFSCLMSSFALVFSIISIMRINKKQILAYQIPANICYSLSYFFKGAFATSLGVVVATIRTLVFFMYNIKDKKAPKYMLYIFIILTISSCLVFYKNLFDILPMFGMCIFTYGTWQSNEFVIKISAILLSVCLFIYNLYCRLYISCFQEILLILSAIISIIKLKYNQNNNLKIQKDMLQ